MVNPTTALVSALLLSNSVLAAKIQYQARYKVGKVPKTTSKTGDVPDGKVQAIVDGMGLWSGYKYKATKTPGSTGLQVFNANNAISFDRTGPMLQEMESLVKKHIK
ncbi:hypothetical protein K461DRAFT_319067 [Myriangium duriaei CBS 260.36]|uniref:Uncharacterized protein n=1 Tax=Myriangium duriaei CBS 260.36 TaxID=1168546 RepID=A0A9P4MH98_9PEZI|nr:hypothetical protein K461DRAFT_319067 [Myriangium duriaei CBS 260.36]